MRLGRKIRTVFISYDYETSSVYASWLKRHFDSEKDIRTISDSDLVPGLPWRDQLLQAISQTDIIIVIVSDKYSAEVRKEVEEARRLSKPIIPMFTDMEKGYEQLNRYGLAHIHGLFVSDVQETINAIRKIPKQ